MSAAGRVTIFTTITPANLGKYYCLDEGGELLKCVGPQMSKGTFEVVHFNGAKEFGALLEAMTSRRALCASTPADGQTSGRVVSKALLAGSPGAVARTKASFTFSERQRGVLILDYDPPQDTALSRDDLWRALLCVAPGLDSGWAVWWPSSSSCLFNGDQELVGVRGQRLYVGVEDASDTARAMRVLTERAWLAGFGRVEVSESGCLLCRSLFDVSMGQTARLDFCGGAVCKLPMEQRRGKPIVLADGEWVDTRQALPDLTPSEQGTLDARMAEAKAARRVEAASSRASWKAKMISRQLPALMTGGASASEAEAQISKTIESAFAGTLLGDFMITVMHADGRVEEASVDHILGHRDHFHELDCLDPLNPRHRGGSPDCRLYLMSASPVAFSWDDGGQVYRLRRQLARVEASPGQRGDLVDALLAAAEVWDDVFQTDAGPVLLERGRLKPLTPARLQLLIGQRVSVVRKTRAGEAPFDVPRDVAELVLTSLQ